MDSVYLGIDLGTGGARAGLFDGHGVALAFSAQSVESYYPRPGWVEQDPDEWWRAIVGAVRGVIADAGVRPQEVAGIGYDATSATPVSLDSHGRPLRRAILWADVRSAAIAARASDIDHWARLYNGGGKDDASAEWFPFKAIWLKEHQPEIWEQTALLLDAPDWIGLQLTGELAYNTCSAAIKCYYNSDHGGWPEDFFAKLGGEDILSKVPSKVQPMGSLLGGLSVAAAEELGLVAGTPVGQGGIDAEAGMVGMNVLTPGDMALITGSSNCLLAQSATALHGPGMFGGHKDAVVPGQYTLEASQGSAGSVMQWFLRTSAIDLMEKEASGGPSAFEVLNELSHEIPPGSDGVVVTEYFQGNRSPYTDNRARGTITGLSLHHRREHIYHAIQEANCYGVEHNLRTMKSLGYHPRSLTVCGGATKSQAWLQMHADILGMDVNVTKVQDGPALGSAILGAVAAGRYASLQEAAQAMVHEHYTLSPDPEKHEEYKFWVDRYTEIHPAMRDIQHSIADHMSDLEG
ncbi:FGGY-family carbohydrate kinase [Ancrocorticia populi]|uniref:FGGY-family carbohydrate kinase n=2 Tax=Ancrocorticia populi TaxID=2175228 RepID=UPI003F901A3B